MPRDPMMSQTLAEPLQGRMHPRARGAAVPAWRRGLAGLVAGAMALSVVLASAMPVRADDNDDLVAALAALALLGVIISEGDNDGGNDGDKGGDRGYDHDDRPRHPDPAQGGWIPAACAIEIEGRDRRQIVVYAESCLDRYDIERLPRRCAREIGYQGGRDRVYGAACLRDAGFRLQPTRHRQHERPD